MGKLYTSLNENSMTSYLIVGGQNGTWGKAGQTPRLYKIFPQTHSVTRISLSAVADGGPIWGTVWGGGWNGSEWLISGFCYTATSSGPYLYSYDGRKTTLAATLDEYGKESSSWSGGDIFAASYNGREWLLSGLGSGILSSKQDRPTNHMSLGTFNGNVFTDLSERIPNQHDAILYANTWNGQYWLVGGGYLGDGVLFAFDGNRITDLTERIEVAVHSFSSVQSIAWNGKYWLIGGVGFLAEYNGASFVDLTRPLKRTLATNNFQSVNAIAWDGESWIMGGGAPVGQLKPSVAWFAVYNASGFVNIPFPIHLSNILQDATIVTITTFDKSWILGGHSNTHGILLSYSRGIFTDLSGLVSDTTYVNWVGAVVTGQGLSSENT